MDLFSYLLGKNSSGGGGSVDTTDLREVMNMSGINVTSDTPFSQYAQDLYDGYSNILKDKYTLIDNMNKGTSTGLITNGLDLPLYEIKMTKESTQDGTPTPENPVPIETVKGYDNIFDISQFSSFCSINTDGFYYSSVNNFYTRYNSGTSGLTMQQPFKTNTQYVIAFTAYVTNTSSNPRFNFLYTDGTAGGTGSNTVTSTTEAVYYLVSTPNKTINKIYYNANYNISGDLYIKDMYVIEASEFVPYNNLSAFSLYINNGEEIKTITPSLKGNEIVGKENNLDEFIIDKYGDCYLKKVFEKIDSYNGETITTDYISTTGELSTGATIYYVRNSPIIIDLEQNFDLTLYEGTNTISNNKNINMEITYIKDTYE